MGKISSRTSSLAEACPATKGNEKLMNNNFPKRNAMKNDAIVPVMGPAMMQRMIETVAKVSAYFHRVIDNLAATRDEF